MHASGPTPNLSVVIPTYNEAANIGHVLSGLPEMVDEIIIVDGHSTDGTIEAAAEVRNDIKFVFQTRRGKGNAMVAGFYSASGDRIVAIDADGSMEPREIPRFVDALDGGAHYVRGSRFMREGGSTDITPLRYAGNQVLNGLANVMCGTRFTDLCYGYVALRRSVLDLMRFPDPFDPGLGRVWGDGFEIETLMAIRAAKAGLQISEVPSFEADRLNGESNLNTFKDGARCLRTLITEGVAPQTISRIPETAPVPVLSIPGVHEVHPDLVSVGRRIADSAAGALQRAAESGAAARRAS
ncbi:glycosyltransferase family 2 protein [Zafaria sp. Z1313]|uniref:glycosyltransferase family 2 protein n=1 Tax=unclassified Zafaria TaxID=2828765 RepID=UPI002E77DD07|nr:glycosyltransferase family 2 protein [Zafaria sp. J156]MEE1620483.1 glycosyltransferase family 2 protein [Zafaria sp. J156]